jgi:hypothetical protein
LSRPADGVCSARRAQLTALGGPGETSWGAGSRVSAFCDACRAGFWKPPSIGAEQAEAGGRVTALVVLGFLLAVQGPHLPILLLQRRRGLTFFCVGAALAKAHGAAMCEGATVVCLVPARTDTIWWHKYAMKHEIRFLRGRLKFGEGKNSAPFPSALVVMRPATFVLGAWTMRPESHPTSLPLRNHSVQRLAALPQISALGRRLD